MSMGFLGVAGCVFFTALPALPLAHARFLGWRFSASAEAPRFSESRRSRNHDANMRVRAGGRAAAIVVVVVVVVVCLFRQRGAGRIGLRAEHE